MPAMPTSLGLLVGAISLLCLALPPQSARAIDPIRDLTGRSLKGHIEHHSDKLQQSADKFFHNPVQYTLDLPQKVFAGACAAFPLGYEQGLRGSVSIWHSLPPNLIQALQPHYSANLAGVRFAVDIATSNGQAQTFGNHIYFPSRGINLGSYGDMHWMLHELEHVVQYANSSWGTNGKLCEYLMKGVGAGFDHDAIDMERAAERKADALTPFALSVMQGRWGPPALRARNELWVRNETFQPVVFYLQTQTFAEYITLPPRTENVFRGAPVDNWFYISIMTNGVTIQYTLNGGTRQHIDWNRAGLLDVFWSN